MSTEIKAWRLPNSTNEHCLGTLIDWAALSVLILNNGHWLSKVVGIHQEQGSVHILPF
jgi:hypothetical protein